MRFDDRCPTAEPGFRTDDGFFKADAAFSCCGCSVKTSWFHTGVMLFFCSPECHAGYVDKPRFSPTSTAESRLLWRIPGLA